eukprot:Rmarinus@m.27642
MRPKLARNAGEADTHKESPPKPRRLKKKRPAESPEPENLESDEDAPTEPTIEEPPRKRTLRDLIFDNKHGEPMKSTVARIQRKKEQKKAKDALRKQAAKEADAASSVASPAVSAVGSVSELASQSGTLPNVDECNQDPSDARSGVDAAPQVHIVDGKIVINENSLALTTASTIPLESRQIRDQWEFRMTSATFSKRSYTKKWTAQDTATFYKGLQRFGTDFSMIAKLFPDRPRNAIKRKFKNEEKMYPARIATALRQQTLVSSPSYYHQLLAELPNANGPSEGGATAAVAAGGDIPADDITTAAAHSTETPATAPQRIPALSPLAGARVGPEATADSGPGGTALGSLAAPAAAPSLDSSPVATAVPAVASAAVSAGPVAGQGTEQSLPTNTPLPASDSAHSRPPAHTHVPTHTPLRGGASPVRLASLRAAGRTTATTPAAASASSTLVSASPKAPGRRMGPLFSSSPSVPSPAGGQTPQASANAATRSPMRNPQATRAASASAADVNGSSTSAANGSPVQQPAISRRLSEVAAAASGPPLEASSSSPSTRPLTLLAAASGDMDAPN